MLVISKTEESLKTCNGTVSFIFNLFFVFAPVQRNWACFTWKGALEICSLLLLSLCYHPAAQAQQTSPICTRQKSKKVKDTNCTFGSETDRLENDFISVLHCTLSIASVKEKCALVVRLTHPLPPTKCQDILVLMLNLWQGAGILSWACKTLVLFWFWFIYWAKILVSHSAEKNGWSLMHSEVNTYQSLHESGSDRSTLTKQLSINIKEIKPHGALIHTQLPQ